jgi:hypothetical protein
MGHAMTETPHTPLTRSCSLSPSTAVRLAAPLTIAPNMSVCSTLSQSPRTQPHTTTDTDWAGNELTRVLSFPEQISASPSTGCIQRAQQLPRRLHVHLRDQHSEGSWCRAHRHPNPETFLLSFAPSNGSGIF